METKEELINKVRKYEIGVEHYITIEHHTNNEYPYYLARVGGWSLKGDKSWKNEIDMLYNAPPTSHETKEEAVQEAKEIIAHNIEFGLSEAYGEDVSSLTTEEIISGINIFIEDEEIKDEEA